MEKEMKDYRINKKGDYIKTINQRTLSDGTEVLDVKFADGRVFKRVLCNKENMQKIVNQQEKQAEEGIALLPELKKRLTCQGIITGCTGALSTIAGYEVIQSLQSEESILIPLSLGLLTVTSFMAGLVPLIKNKLVIKEIEKIIKECTNLDTEDILSNYNVYKKGVVYDSFRLNLLGYHNVINSLFAIIKLNF